MEQIIEEYGGLIIALVFILVIIAGICMVVFGGDDGNSVMGKFIQLIFSRFC